MLYVDDNDMNFFFLDFVRANRAEKWGKVTTSLMGQPKCMETTSTTIAVACQVYKYTTTMDKTDYRAIWSQGGKQHQRRDILEMCLFNFKFINVILQVTTFGVAYTPNKIYIAHSKQTIHQIMICQELST